MHVRLPCLLRANVLRPTPLSTVPYPRAHAPIRGDDARARGAETLTEPWKLAFPGAREELGARARRLPGPRYNVPRDRAGRWSSRSRLNVSAAALGPRARHKHGRGGLQRLIYTATDRSRPSPFLCLRTADTRVPLY